MARAEAPGSLPAASAPASVPASGPAPTLATCIPDDAALYVEIRGLQRILGSATGAGVASTVFQVFRSAATSGPAEASSPGGPAQLFASAVGLQESFKAVQMLFSGPVAVAADGWSGLSDAVFVGWPVDAKALEAALNGQRLAETESAPIRRYVLGNGHELACDGRTVVIGRPKRTSLYTRTLELLKGNGRPLSEHVEFRERMGSVAHDAQVTAYVGKSGPGAGEGQNPLTAWWPEDWPWIRTVALGLVWGRGGAHVKFSARLHPEGPELTRSEPPIQVLRRLPGSVVAVWTQAVDYRGDFRRLRGRLALEPDGFRLDSLEAGLEAGTIEKQILGHLVGDTVLLLDQVAVTPKEPGATEQLILPTGAILVETDDPDAVAAALPLVAGNLVRLFNSQTPAGQTISIHEEALPGGAKLYSIPIGIPQTGKTRCDLLQALELSWAVADRWLVVATHSQTVRQLAEARRGGGELLGVTALDKVIEQVVQRGGQPRRVLFAQPQAGAAMIDTWIRHISKHHPEMLQAQWWERLLQRQRAMGKQVGILARAESGTVEVVDALPDGPARGRLMPGDRILAVDGVKIDPANPLQSLREAVAQRGQPGRVMLLVRRGEADQEIELPMPKEQVEGGLRSPVELLKWLSSACRLFDSTSYVLWQPTPDVVEARIDLEYRHVAKPVPASKPAPSSESAPASSPAAASAPAVTASRPTAVARPTESRPAAVGTQPAVPASRAAAVTSQPAAITRPAASSSPATSSAPR